MSDNQPDTPQPPESLKDRVAAVIDTIRPAIQGDGVVSVRLHGACVGCPSAGMTLTMGVERTLKDRVAEVTSVVSV